MTRNDDMRPPRSRRHGNNDNATRDPDVVRLTTRKAVAEATRLARLARRRIKDARMHHLNRAGLLDLLSELYLDIDDIAYLLTGE